MLKLNHIITTDNGDTFSSIRYLLDYNPEKSIDYYSTPIKHTKIEDLLELLTPVCTFTHLIYSRYVNAENSAILEITSIVNSDDSKDVFIIGFTYCNSFDIEKLKKEVLPLLKEEEEKKGFRFNLVTINRGEPQTLVKYSNKEISIDKENSYNLDCPLDTVIEDIKSDKSGLMIFNSNPGAGKTSLIKYLAQELTEKNFYFLSNSNLDILSNPAFTSYCLQYLSNSVLVLEDCEKALVTRDLNKGYDISNILNITDGIMGDLLNLKIIATLNTTDKLDSALLRKGRLIRQVEFKPLTKEQVVNLSTSLGKVIEDPKEMMLCEVYNSESNGTEIKKLNKIGF